MINSIGAMHVALRAQKRKVEPPKVVVETKKRRRYATSEEHANARDQTEQRGTTA